jgi:hypothetical protein
MKIKSDLKLSPRMFRLGVICYIIGAVISLPTYFFYAFAYDHGKMPYPTSLIFGVGAFLALYGGAICILSEFVDMYKRMRNGKNDNAGGDDSASGSDQSPSAKTGIIHVDETGLPPASRVFSPDEGKVDDSELKKIWLESCATVA